MKKLLILTMAMVFSFGITACKKVKVPEKVKTAFSQKFQKASDIDWDQEKNNTWEAEFTLKAVEMSATFTNKGVWLETETEIKLEALPDAVQKTVQAKFADYQLKGAEYIEKPDFSGYEIMLKAKNGDKIEVLFDKSGKGLKREKITDED